MTPSELLRFIAAAPAPQAQPAQGKPVAEIVIQDSGRFTINVHLQKPEDEFTLPAGTHQLYLQSAQPVAQPLTDDKIWKSDNIMEANSSYGADFETLRNLVRAIEAAHGIKKGTV